MPLYRGGMIIKAVTDLQSAFGTYRAAADALGMSPQALNDCRRRGNLPTTKYFEQRAIIEHYGHKSDPALWGFTARVAA